MANNNKNDFLIPKKHRNCESGKLFILPNYCNSVYNSFTINPKKQKKIKENQRIT
uniref:Uncharacterized protein n=1 Tax=Rhizophora mucronata TaxID=61149 RepID=A0A2P2PQN9_RHIMU